MFWCMYTLRLCTSIHIVQLNEGRCWHCQTQVPLCESFQVPALLPKHLPVVRQENNLSLFSDQNRCSKTTPKRCVSSNFSGKKSSQLVETILNCRKTLKVFVHLFPFPIFLGENPRTHRYIWEGEFHTAGGSPMELRQGTR